MEKIGSICTLNRGGLSLKKGPLSYIYSYIYADGPLFIFFLGAWLYKASIPWKRLGPSAF